MPKITTPDGVSLKEKRAVKEKLKGHTKADAIRLAGYKTKHASQMAHTVFSKPRVQAYEEKERTRMQSALRKHGIDDEYKAMKLKEHLEAKDEFGNPLFTVQDKSLDKVFKIDKDYESEQKHEHQHLHVSVTEQMLRDLDDGKI